MQDPKPENIRGAKVERHTFEHRIHWGYALLGLAAIYVTWKLSGAFLEAERDKTEGESGRDPEVMG